MGVYINNKIILERQEKKQNKLALQGLGQELTQEKLKNIQKDQIINKLGRELTQIKLQLLQNNER